MRDVPKIRRDASIRPLVPLLAIALLLFAGGGGGASEAAPASAIAGSYKVAVRLVENHCGAVTVLPQPTTVRHSPGDTRFALQHGGLRFAATLAADDTFVADPLVLNGEDGSMLTVRLAGSFTLGATTTLAATVTVETRGRPSPPASCRYVVTWKGAKRAK